jgi:endonuclease/exonuclease/phosphatase family metal-dependent hydrolase
MTYNIGGGRRDFGTVLDSVLDVVRQTQPDVLALQEATRWLDADGHWHSSVNFLADVLGNGYQSFFGPTITLQQHFSSEKSNFLRAIFDDLQDWQFGNALLVRGGFAQLSDPTRPGQPYNLPIFRPAQYLGNRDTDPRHILLTRIAGKDVSPLVVATHLTTLLGERGGPERLLPGKTEQAEQMRCQQTHSLLNILQPYAMQKGELIFLLGDLNATEDEACMANLRQAGFTHLHPENDGIATHTKLCCPVDHILVYPAARLKNYQCRVIDTPIARQASDHLPVVADVWVE